MKDWREIAVDDIINELEETSEEGKKQLEEKKVKIKPNSDSKLDRCPPSEGRTVSFCCTTTIPGGFSVVAGTQRVAFVEDCLRCIKTIETLPVYCEGIPSSAPCGEVEVCTIRVTGCIPFIAGAFVNGDEGSTSAICCQGCVCVDECVACFPIEDNGCSCFDSGTSECSGFAGIPDVDAGAVTVTVTPCSSGANSQTVRFTGTFTVTCNQPV
ncbi:hypothetical protein GOM49_07595 [Clostridium bovifaecis]|uniref:Uncharacterized protein n=1 Tax=Clostridium bovifaecis TaxID=2184719 RepID=A0A6I6ERC5_9CLOT|nr:hypothetical protein GOM49_07595 [Clostridium bovifaecis]